MRVSVTLEVTDTGEPREGRRTRALDAYRLVTLAIVFIIALVECGTAFNARWSGDYPFGVAITTVIMTAVAATAQIAGPITGPVWLELALTFVVGILWMVVGIVPWREALFIPGWIAFGFITLYGIVLALATACQVPAEASVWARPVHALGQGQIRLKEDHDAHDPQTSAESAQTLASAQAQPQGVDAV